MIIQLFAANSMLWRFHKKIILVQLPEKTMKKGLDAIRLGLNIGQKRD